LQHDAFVEPLSAQEIDHKRCTCDASVTRYPSGKMMMASSFDINITKEVNSSGVWTSLEGKGDEEEE
jgi:hypothetical protein